MKDVYCPIPWMFQAVRNNGDVRICCQANVTKNQGVVRKEDGSAFTADDQFKSYEDLKLRLETTLKGNYSKPVDEEVFEEEADTPTPVATTAPSAPETDTLSYFAQLAQDD